MILLLKRALVPCLRVRKPSGNFRARVRPISRSRQVANTRPCTARAHPFVHPDCSFKTASPVLELTARLVLDIWLRRSAPVTHQAQGIELGGCPPHSPPLVIFAAPENRPFPRPSTHRGALRHCTGLVAACPWPPRGMLQPHLAQAAGAANSLNFGAGSTRAGIQVSWL